MDSRYSHQEHEAKILALWQSHQLGKPSETGDPFTIIMPPPNANDPLHIGHALFVTLEDIMIRYQRALGKAALWLPGTDHAGIETQFVFEKKLKKQGQSRFQFDRNSLYSMIAEYVKDNSSVAIEQMKRLGASADWSRYRFTLDNEIVSQVIETFCELSNDDLVYRDLKLVNYCTTCGTAFSELEVEHVERTDALYYMKYGPFTLATVRPETKFGDTAVAVNPNDPRYQEFVGQTIEVEGLLGTFTIQVIADEYVDPEFGTGVVKITPAHDPNDFEVWKRHQDEIPGPKQVIGFDGKLNHLTGPYQGMKVEAAREQVAKDLDQKGLLVKTDPNYTHSVGTCYRCGRVLEPLPLAQFFVKTTPLTKPILKALDTKELVVIGAGHDKILKHWLTNLKDWNISRQIVWGIRMPVYYPLPDSPTHPNAQIEVAYLDKSGKRTTQKLFEALQVILPEELASNLQQLQAPLDAVFEIHTNQPSTGFIQETDTFDTWFSSAQWPFAAIRAGGEADFDRFYPTDVMETGHDILPFWVLRMLLLGYYKTKQLPFKIVYMHGLIRDGKGQKMSKSKGNVINPLVIADQCGADALRMALVIRSSPGLDKNVAESDIKAMRNFTNKIWNATRFVTTLSDNGKGSEDTSLTQETSQLVSEVSAMLDNYRLGLAADTIYDRFWHWYCDLVIEQAKSGAYSKTAMVSSLVTLLSLLHPFMPFVTEACYQALKQDASLSSFATAPTLALADWPTS